MRGTHLWCGCYPIGCIVLIDPIVNASSRRGVVRVLGMLGMVLGVVMLMRLMVLGHLGGRLCRRVLACPWIVCRVSQGAYFVSEDATDGRDRGNVVLVADPIRQETVPNLPGKNARIFLFEFADEANDLGSCDPGLAAPNSPRQDGSRLVVASKDL